MNEILGARIKNIRESKNLTQEDIAARLGMSRQRFARIEKGVSDISYDLILKISRILNICPDEITSAASTCESGQTEFRMAEGTGAKFDSIIDMLDLFYANKHVYEGVRRGEE